MCSPRLQGWARCRIEPLSAFRVAGPHLSCGHVMAGAGSSALASVKPRLSKPAPRAGPAAYVRDPRATVTDHRCSRGPLGFLAWPLHIFMDATAFGGNLVDDCKVEADIVTSSTDAIVEGSTCGCIPPLLLLAARSTATTRWDGGCW
jgi:hypothetical protein